MECKAKIIAMSHLSDHLIDNNNVHINFVQFLLLELNGDLTKEIDADKYWNKFQKRFVIPMELES